MQGVILSVDPAATANQAGRTVTIRSTSIVGEAYTCRLDGLSPAVDTSAASSTFEGLAVSFNRKAQSDAVDVTLL